MTQAIARFAGRAAARPVPALLALLLLLSACQVRLAPEFDRGILDGLVEANRQTMMLFAAVEGGGDPAGFPQRDPQYQEAIGRFAALRIEAQARPQPSSPLADLFGLGGAEPPEAASIVPLETPTPAVLEQIVALLTQMRQTDRAGTLTETKVAGFKNSYETGIAQALVYEKALER